MSDSEFRAEGERVEIADLEHAYPRVEPLPLERWSIWGLMAFGLGLMFCIPFAGPIAIFCAYKATLEFETGKATKGELITYIGAVLGLFGCGSTLLCIHMLLSW